MSNTQLNLNATEIELTSEAQQNLPPISLKERKAQFALSVKYPDDEKIYHKHYNNAEVTLEKFLGFLLVHQRRNNKEAVHSFLPGVV